MASKTRLGHVGQVPCPSSAFSLGPAPEDFLALFHLHLEAASGIPRNFLCCSPLTKPVRNKNSDDSTGGAVGGLNRGVQETHGLLPTPVQKRRFPRPDALTRGYRCQKVQSLRCLLPAPTKTGTQTWAQEITGWARHTADPVQPLAHHMVP